MTKGMETRVSVTRELLGEVLIRERVISPDRLRAALDVQKRDPKLLGEILLDLGFAQECDILNSLIIQNGVPYISASQYEVDESIVAMFPAGIAWKYDCLPLDRFGDVLSVVMVDPLSADARRDIEEGTGCLLTPFFGRRSEIRLAITRYYGEPDNL